MNTKYSVPEIIAATQVARLLKILMKSLSLTLSFLVLRAGIYVHAVVKCQIVFGTEI
jgi:hypothetical protein